MSKARTSISIDKADADFLRDIAHERSTGQKTITWVDLVREAVREKIDKLRTERGRPKGAKR
jgi:hypothetical protein